MAKSKSSWWRRSQSARVCTGKLVGLLPNTQMSRVALRRVARHGQGWFGFNLAPDQVAPHLATLDELLAAEGRSRSEIEVSVGPYTNEVGPNELEAYAAAGVDQLVLMAMAPKIDEFRAIVDDLARTLVEPARSL